MKDIFFLWKHGEENLKSFINDVNKIHPSVKLTAERSKKPRVFKWIGVY